LINSKKNNTKNISIVGSGIAGISCAIRLKNEGYNVKVYEKNKSFGGKIDEIKMMGYRFDIGPSLLTMPKLIKDVFELTGKNINNYLNFKRKKYICNYFYEDGTRFKAPSDKKEFAKRASEIFDVTESELISYFELNKKKYDLTNGIFLKKSLHKLSSYLSIETVKAILNIGKLGIFKNLSELNDDTFNDERLVQFYNRFSTYNGSSPYKTPAIMSMIPHLEQHYGVYFPKGGMKMISKKLFELALEIGVEFNFSSEVQEIIIKNKKAIGLKINSKEILSDIVISNSDIEHTYKNLMPNQIIPNHITRSEKSSSAIIFLWGIKKKFEELDLHNIFFSSDYKQEFDDIFQNKVISEDPTIYINISSKENINDAPENCENWFTMINVPSNQGQDWSDLIKSAKKNIIKKLNKNLKADVESYIEFEKVISPIDIEKNTNSSNGSLYGSSSNDKFSALLRHSNFSNKIKNLYFCGGSVHPGGGIPLCLLSAKIVSDLVKT
tara:strand:- start:1468 stop:2955 length:1488 start_codon:yes stop_codon:yes gene_type:complete